MDADTDSTAVDELDPEEFFLEAVNVLLWDTKGVVDRLLTEGELEYANMNKSISHGMYLQLLNEYEKILWPNYNATLGGYASMETYQLVKFFQAAINSWLKHSNTEHIGKDRVMQFVDSWLDDVQEALELDRGVEKKFISSWSAALKIQELWRKCISDPHYAICRRRLQREFEECQAEMEGVQ